MIQDVLGLIEGNEVDLGTVNVDEEETEEEKWVEEDEDDLYDFEDDDDTDLQDIED